MEITTSQSKTGGARFVINCDHSTVASAVVAERSGNEMLVDVTYLNGAEWRYVVATETVLDFMGGDSVGRFINIIKREAHIAYAA